MNIRRRMDSDLVTVLTVGGLAATALVHAAWASGATWPRESSDELADLVVGKRPFPNPAATWAVTALLAGATVVVAANGRAASTLGRRFPRLIGLAARSVATVLFTRGAGGLAASSMELFDSTEEFRRWDLRFYSPLCLALAAGAVRSGQSR